MVPPGIKDLLYSFTLLFFLQSVMWTVVVALLAILIVFCIKASIRPSNFPPGPPCIAWLGSLPWLDVRNLSRLPPTLNLILNLQIVPEPEPEIRGHLLHLRGDEASGGAQQLGARVRR